jgi:hypothetical protein
MLPISIELAGKLGSIAIYAQNLLAVIGSEPIGIQLERLLHDPDVASWLKKVRDLTPLPEPISIVWPDPLLPALREAVNNPQWEPGPVVIQFTDTGEYFACPSGHLSHPGVHMNRQYSMVIDFTNLRCANAAGEHCLEDASGIDLRTYSDGFLLRWVRALISH